MHAFEKTWNNAFPNIPPAGWRIRECFPDRWVRFHSLPASKRYAQNEKEMSIILDRATILAKRVLGENEECWLCVSVPESGSPRYENKLHWAWRAFNLTKVNKWADHREGEDDAFYWNTYAAEIIWSQSNFNGQLRRIARDLEPAVIWVAKDMSALFAPYDGGFDILMPNSESVTLIKNEFQNWLSDSPSGL